MPTITLYINAEDFEAEAEKPLTDARLRLIGEQVNEDAASIFGYESWETQLEDPYPFTVGVTATCERLAAFASHDAAADFIGTLPDHEDGRYFLDGPA